MPQSAMNCQDIRKPESYVQDENLARNFLPFFQFHSREEFYPSSIEFILKHASLFNGSLGKNGTPNEKRLLTSVQVNELIRIQSLGVYSNLNLRGHGSAKTKAGQLNTSEHHQVPVYCHVRHGTEFTDIIYILMYNFNGPAGLPGLQYFGSNAIGLYEHDFDLEHVRVRIINQEGVWKLNKVYCSAHDSEGVFVEAKDLVRHLSSFKVFIAVNSHASYHQAKTWVRAFGFANDYTDSQGLCWHPLNQIQMIYAPISLDEPNPVYWPGWMKYAGWMNKNGIQNIAQRDWWQKSQGNRPNNALRRFLLFNHIFAERA